MSGREKVIGVALCILALAVFGYLMWGRTDRTAVDHSAQPANVGESEPGQPDGSRLSGEPDTTGASGPSGPGAVPGSSSSPINPPFTSSSGATQFSLRGRVLSEGGQPLQGAEIQICAGDSVRSCPNAVRVYSQTGGAFQAQIPFDRETPYSVLVQKPGFLETEGRLRMKAPGGIQQDFVLRQASALLSGRVLGPQGRPVAGAAVIVNCYSRTGAPSVDSAVAQSSVKGNVIQAAAASDGRYTVRELPAGKAMVTVQAPGYRQASVVVLELQPGENSADVRLEAARLVTLTVRNRRGEPVDQVVVRATNSRSAGELSGRATRPGTVEITVPLDLAYLRCEVSAPGYKATSLDLEPVTPPEVVILDDAPMIQGQVIAENGQPIAGAEVRAFSGRPTSSGGQSYAEGSGVSDNAGEFRLNVSYDRHLQLVVRKNGFLGTRVWVEAADEGRDLRIVLKRPQAALHGRVVDSQGRPVRPFTVAVSEMRATPAAFRPGQRPDLIQMMRSEVGFRVAGHFDSPDGHFEFAELPSGRLNLVIDSPAGSHSTTVDIRSGLDNEMIVRMPSP